MPDAKPSWKWNRAALAELSGIYMTLAGSVMAIAGMWVAIAGGSVLYFLVGLGFAGLGVAVLRHRSS